MRLTIDLIQLHIGDNSRSSELLVRSRIESHHSAAKSVHDSGKDAADPSGTDHANGLSKQVVPDQALK